MPTQIAWPTAIPTAELAHLAATTLRSGQSIVVPTEIGPVLAFSPADLTNPDRPDGLPQSWTCTRYDGYFDSAELFERNPSVNPDERAIIQRIVPGRAAIDIGSGYPVWMPSHLAAATVLMASSPLALFEIQSDTPIDWSTLGDRVGLLIAETAALKGKPTIVRVRGRNWTITKPGSVSEPEIRNALNRKIVFVCTGNTCRSPMAEAIFKKRLSERLSCGVDELPTRGYTICSAGVAAGDGDAATESAVEILREWDIDLSGHRSRPAGVELMAKADDVIVMTRSHLAAILGRMPVLNGNFRLLRGSEGDLDDPLGSGVESYRACARMISHHVDRLILEMSLS